MRTREVGTSGLVVSLVGLGCNNFGSRIDEASAHAVVQAAIDAGITLFDTAESYGSGQSETFLGRAIRGRREQVVVATKFGWISGPAGSLARGSAAYIRVAIEASLERLGTDYIDLYQYHRPDGVTPIEETLGALEELVTAGKVRFIGSSNFSGEQVSAADEAARAGGLSRFVSAQNAYSLLAREAEAELVPVLERLGIGLIPYFPLANGLLTGKYRRGQPPPAGSRLSAGVRLSREREMSDEAWDRIEALERFGSERGLSLLDVAIGGLAAQPAVSSVIAGATSPEQVRANASAGEWEPSAGEIDLLRSL